MSLLSFLGTILTTVVGKSVLWPFPRLPQCREPYWWSWSFFGLTEDVCWVEDDCFSLDVSAEAELIDLFFSNSLSSVFAGLFPWRHLESILRVLEDNWSIVFVFTLAAFSTASSQKSRSRPRASKWVRAKGFRSFRKHWIMISLFGVAARSNSWRTACKCSRWAVYLRTSSCWCWESFLSFSQ